MHMSFPLSFLSSLYISSIISESIFVYFGNVTRLGCACSNPYEFLFHFWLQLPKVMCITPLRDGPPPISINQGFA